MGQPLGFAAQKVSLHLKCRQEPQVRGLSPARSHWQSRDSSPWSIRVSVAKSSPPQQSGYPVVQLTHTLATPPCAPWPEQGESEISLGSPKKGSFRHLPCIQKMGSGLFSPNFCAHPYSPELLPWGEGHMLRLYNTIPVPSILRRPLSYRMIGNRKCLEAKAQLPFQLHTVFVQSFNTYQGPEWQDADLTRKSLLSLGKGSKESRKKCCPCISCHLFFLNSLSWKNRKSPSV